MHPYFIHSPESHNVIWCGKQVRRRSCLPRELYERLNQEVPLITMHDISPNLVKMSMLVFDAVCRYINILMYKKSYSTTIIGI